MQDKHDKYTHPMTFMEENYLDIKEAVAVLQYACHKDARDAGWWHDINTGRSILESPYTFSNKIALCHSELSEALEADRKKLMDDKLPSREGREVELVDALIRIFDLMGAYGMDGPGAFAEKMMYNSSRQDHKKDNRQQAGGKAY